MTRIKAGGRAKAKMARMRRWLGFIFCALAAGAPGAQPAGERRFQDTEEWARRFDDPGRDAWQKPREVIRALELARDSVVADIGSGTGYFAVRLARAVPQGRVYGSDIEPAMVEHLRKRAGAEGLSNLQAVQAGPDSPNLPEPVDRVLLVNVQGLMVSPGDYFQRLRPFIKPGGRVVIIAARIGSSAGPPAAMRVPPEKIKQDMARQGYALIMELDFLPHQYFLVFQPVN